MRTLLLASVVTAGLFGFLSAIPAPYNAFCRSLWLFAAPCAKISLKLVQQIETFNPLNGCDECQYTLVSTTPLTIKVNHTSSITLHQTETLTFTLSPTMLTPGCRVTAQSISLNATSLLDGGLNYCNLHKLLAASGLTFDPGFMEMINEWACLGYRLATC